MQLRLQHVSPRRLLRPLVRALLEHLPTLVLFGLCAYAFLHFVIILVGRFLAYPTTVLIRYEAPTTIVFPAFTICGCSASNVVCRNSSWWSIGQEMVNYRRRPVLEILDRYSLRETDLVTQCYYFRDSREPDLRVPCTALEEVVESLQDGRKCLTYLTKLHDTHSAGQESELNSARLSAETGDQYTAFIYIKVNFSQFVHPTRYEGYQPAPTVRDANVIMAVHQTNSIPTQLDADYIRVEPGLSYEIHFGKQVTSLLEKPYTPDCQRYDPQTKPRSRNECVHLCSIAESFAAQQCINHYQVVTRGWLRYMEQHGNRSAFKSARERFCPNSDGNEPYPSYVTTRRRCLARCGRDCTEENYSLVVDSSFLNAHDTLQQEDASVNQTVIVIWPDRKMYEMIEHHREIDIFELIGTLGGHAHIWLGISAIQLYDVFYLLLQKVKVAWRRFVYCSLGAT